MDNFENKIICGDCLEMVGLLQDDSVDLVFASPPYRNARTYRIGFSLKGQDWVDWARLRFMECLRVSRGLVAWVVEGQTSKFRYTAEPILLMADLHRAGVHLRKPPAFHRVGIPGSGGPDWLRNDYEFIICATSGGKLPWSNNIAMGHPPKWAPGGDMSHRISDGSRVNQWGGNDKSGNNRKQNGSRQKTGRPSHQKLTKRGMRRKNGERREHGYTLPPISNPGNTIQQKYTTDEVLSLLEHAGDITHHKVGGGQMGSKLAHENEAPFPETLAEFFIRSFCPKGGIVLDPFCGSGTTCAVAEKTGRRWMGIDIRKDQVKLSDKRIAEARQVTKELF